MKTFKINGKTYSIEKLDLIIRCILLRLNDAIKTKNKGEFEKGYIQGLETAFYFLTFQDISDDEILEIKRDEILNIKIKED